MSLLRAAWLVALKDLQLEIRTKEILTSTGLFAVLVVTLGSLAFYTDPVSAPNVAPGVLWISILFCGILLIGRSWALERENDAVFGLLLAPIPRAAIYVGKTISALALLFVIELLLVPLCLVFFQIEPSGIVLPLLGLVFLGSVGFVSTATLFSAVGIRTRARDLMLSVLVFPLVAPALLAASRCHTRALCRRDGHRGPRLDAHPDRLRPLVRRVWRLGLALPPRGGLTRSAVRADQVERDGVRPIERAVVAKPDHTISVDDPGLREEPRTEPTVHDLAVGVEQARDACVARDDRLHLVPIAIRRYGHDFDVAPRLDDLCQELDGRHLLNAGTAGHRPKVQHDHLPAMIGELPLTPTLHWKGEVRGAKRCAEIVRHAAGAIHQRLEAGATEQGPKRGLPSSRTRVDDRTREEEQERERDGNHDECGDDLSARHAQALALFEAK